MTDRLATILIIGLLGVTALVCATALTAKGYDGAAYVGLAIGALGVLAPSPLSKSATAGTVTIDNPPDNPVPVDPQP